MRIFFDHQTFSLQNYGGVSRYFCELITGINHTNNQAHLSLLYSNNAHLQEYHLKTYTYPFPKRQRLLYRSNQYWNLLDLKASHFDIYHTTYYDPFFISSLGHRPYVVTYHDMIYELYANKYAGLAAASHLITWKKSISYGAAVLIAVSESTKRDMVEWLNVSPDQIQVTHLGNSLHPDVVAQPNTNMPYLLYVGNRSMYKNFEMFLSAAAPLLRRYGLRLICAGGGRFSADETIHITMLGLTNVVEQHSINDKTLARLYSQAVAFVFPSLYEGFGIPILEAMVCGCPCLLSNRSSLPEVAGNAAIYFEPEDVDSIQSSLAQLLDDASLRAKLIQKGFVREKLFSWRKTVDQTLSIYKGLI